MLYIEVQYKCQHCGGSFSSKWPRMTCPLCKEVL